VCVCVFVRPPDRTARVPSATRQEEEEEERV